MYDVIKFVHVIAVFAFLMAHGISAGAAFSLRAERSPERVRALLMQSANSYPVMYVSLLILLATGVINGFMGHWWGYAWIWISLILLIAIAVLMTIFGSSIYGGARKLAGLPFFDQGKPHPPIEPSSEAELDAQLSKGNPILLFALGFSGIAVIGYLMMFHPF
jgi:MFS family permease